MRVNDRVVHENRAGVVTMADNESERASVRFDDGEEVHRIDYGEILITSSVPVKVRHSYGKGDRMRTRSGVILYVVNPVTIGDEPGYEMSDESLLVESDLRYDPLPDVDDDTFEEMMTAYFLRGIKHLTREAEERGFDTTRAIIAVECEGEDDKIRVKYTTKYGWSDAITTSDSLTHAMNETIRRKQHDKDTAPKRLPRL